MTGKLKQKAISGMMWNAVEKFGSTLFLFLSNLVLARLLMPSDFGTIAMLMVFISISETIVEAGLSNALIQKKEANDLDYSTVFLWNVFFSILLYILLFILSPQISKFYNNEALCLILRIQGIILLLNSLVVVHIARLKRELRFKLSAQINLLSVIIGTVTGIIMAFIGLGVWSLVVKMLVSSFMQIVCYYYRVKWLPNLHFDYGRFSDMFKFGIWILLSRIVNSVFHNMMALMIGKFMSSSTLGYYNQAKKLEDIPRSTISSIVNNVAFPIFSKINDDNPRFKNNARLCLRCLVFVSTPLMILGIVVAKPLILLLFTAKWSTTIEYFQLLCIGAIALTPLELNYEFINALGYSRVSFNIKLLQRIIGVFLMFLGITWGIYGILMAYILGQFISFLIAGYESGRKFGYGIIEQLVDMAPSLFISLLSLLVCFFETRLLIITGNIVPFIVRIVTFLSVFGLMSTIFCRKEIRFIKESIYRIIKTKSYGKT